MQVSGVNNKSLRFICLFSVIINAGCGLSEEDWEDLRTLGPLTEEEAVPPSPTNAYAEDPGAALLGQALFFDERMSADGEISCASCHVPDNNFADIDPVSKGVDDRTGDRHAPTLINLVIQDFYFWDGRTDSLWSTPLQAIEAGPEADFTRVEVAHFIARHYRVPYETVFEPLPDLSGLPSKGRPGLAPWEEMSAEQQNQVNLIFSNVGKSLEAYQRKLTCMDTRFDRVIAGEAEFTSEEAAGARQFVRRDEGNCIACHSGTNFSDNDFHRLPLPGLRGYPDEGRLEGIPKLLEDTFNTRGIFSDNTGFGEEQLENLGSPDGTRGQFKTPTLRGVAQRKTFGHLGNVETLDDWLEDVYDNGGGRRGRGDRDNRDSFDDEVRRIDFDEEDMAAFLRTLNCNPLPPELLQPPTRLPGMGGEEEAQSVE